MVVHRLGHQRIALRPVIAALGDEPDAHGVAAGHQPEAVVLDLVNPIGAGRRNDETQNRHRRLYRRYCGRN